MSRLFDEACSTLDDVGRGRVTALLTRMEAVVGPDPPNQTGADIARLLRDEEQLSDRPDDADGTVLADLLLELCAALDGVSDAGALARRYESAMDGGFRLRGPATAARPAALRRYLNGPGLFKAVVSHLRDIGEDEDADELARLIAEAHGGRPGMTWEPVAEFLRDAHVWAMATRGGGPGLSASESTFVTFDAPGVTVRPDSASWMHAALALWKPRSECFVALTYAPVAGEPLRTPTLADAGWYRHFRGAPAGAPHGWTHPHADADLRPAPEPQPEAVHSRPRLGRLRRSGDLRLLAP